MGLLSRAKQSSAAKRDAKETEHKPAATFWDDPAPASTEGQKHSKVEQSEHTFGFNPDLELQTQIGGSSREYGQQSINARQEDVQPTSRARIEDATRPRQSIRDANLIGELSTHRVARQNPSEEAAKRAIKKDEQESRAWRSLTAMLELFAR